MMPVLNNHPVTLALEKDLIPWGHHAPRSGSEYPDCAGAFHWSVRMSWERYINIIADDENCVMAVDADAIGQCWQLLVN